MMRYTTAVAVFLTAVNAQNMGPKANCTKFADIKPIPDPFYMFEPGKADFHCDMGVPIPFGPVPAGCAKLEIIVGKCLENDLSVLTLSFVLRFKLVAFNAAKNFEVMLTIIAARGTSEPGPLGQIVGDPLVARVKRDMKEISVQGYPVQVS
jgi:hypothetical protein